MITPFGMVVRDTAASGLPLARIAAFLECRVDLLLAEGFKSAVCPKIAVLRRNQRGHCPARRTR